MKILIFSEPYLYDGIQTIKSKLEANGHIIVPTEEYRKYNVRTYFTFMAKDCLVNDTVMKISAISKIDIDALLVLNISEFDNGHHIGIDSFLTMDDAFNQHKKIYIYNPIATVLENEIYKFSPVILNGDLDLIKDTDLYLINLREKYYGTRL